MKYRSEIDGLRAVAIIPVVLFHAGVPFFSGGYVGVDIFFVISGYLITSLLMSAMLDEGRSFSYFGFMAKRARRILPALYLVLSVTLLLGGGMMPPDQFLNLSYGLISVILNVSNIFLWLSADYFAASSELNPLLHTWSLAVEEQFYIFFPLVLLLILKKFSKYLLFVLILLLSLSFALCLFLEHKPNANFYLLPTRAWELGAGVVCAVLCRNYEFRSSSLLSAIGISLIIISVVAFDVSTPFPSAYTLMPVVGACLVICYAKRGSEVARALSIRPLVWVGVLSYSMYLWHQPLFAYGRIYSGATIELYMFLMLLTLVLALLTYHFVETPVRRLKGSASVVALWVLLGVSVVMLVVALLAHFCNGFSDFWRDRNPGKVEVYDLTRSLVGEVKAMQVDKDECKFRIRSVDFSAIERMGTCFRKHGQGKVIFGDSHATDVFLGYKYYDDEAFVVGYTLPGCRLTSPDSFGCVRADILRDINSISEYFSEVIYTQSGSYLFKDRLGDSGRGVFERVSVDSEIDGLVQFSSHQVEDLVKLLDQVDGNVVFLGPRFEPHIPFSKVLRRGCHGVYSFRGGQYRLFVRLDSYLRANIKRGRYFSQILPEDEYRNHFSCETFYWRDGDHWSRAGIEYYMKENFESGL